MVSHYFYHRNSKTDRFHHVARDHRLEEWVTLSLDGQDVQTQFISGLYGKPNETVYQMAEEHLRTVWPSVAAGETRQRERLTHGCHLEGWLCQQFGFVGLFERFDESILMLRYYAGFHNLLYNKTKAVVSRPRVQGACSRALRLALAMLALTAACIGPLGG